MTREEFKRRWESDEAGGGITNEDIEQCAYSWKIAKKSDGYSRPQLIALVTAAAGTADADYWAKDLPEGTHVLDCNHLDRSDMIKANTTPKKKRRKKMPVSEAKKRSNAKWKAKAMRRIPLEVRKEYYENVVSKIPDVAGMPVNTFIKIALTEKIQRDGLALPIDEYRP